MLAGAYREATGTTLSERHRAALVSLARTTAGTRRIDLPGATVVREYARLRFLPPAATDVRPGTLEAEKPLVRGSSVEWHGWRISLGVQNGELPYTASVDAASAARLVVREKMASISFLQRRMGVGFSRAGKLIDMMQRDGIVGPPSGGAKSREVLMPPDYFDEIDRSRRD